MLDNGCLLIGDIPLCQEYYSVIEQVYKYKLKIDSDHVTTLANLIFEEHQAKEVAGDLILDDSLISVPLQQIQVPPNARETIFSLIEKGWLSAKKIANIFSNRIELLTRDEQEIIKTALLGEYEIADLTANFTKKHNVRQWLLKMFKITIVNNSTPRTDGYYYLHAKSVSPISPVSKQHLEMQFDETSSSSTTTTSLTLTNSLLFDDLVKNKKMNIPLMRMSKIVSITFNKNGTVVLTQKTNSGTEQLLGQWKMRKNKVSWTFSEYKVDMQDDNLRVITVSGGETIGDQDFFKFKQTMSVHYLNLTHKPFGRKSAKEISNYFKSFADVIIYCKN